jgi:flagellar biosynthetic protein FlhB
VSEAPDRDSRTEQATPKRLADAREKGNLALSREAATFAYLAAVLAVLAWLAGAGMLRLTAALAAFIERPAQWRLEHGTDAARLLVDLDADAAVAVLRHWLRTG